MKQNANFFEGGNSSLNLRPIPELGRSGNDPTGQQFRVGQMVNKPMVPNPNFQSSSVNLNSILNVDRPKQMLPREFSGNGSPIKEFGKRDSVIGDLGSSKRIRQGRG